MSSNGSKSLFFCLCMIVGSPPLLHSESDIFERVSRGFKCRLCGQVIIQKRNAKNHFVEKHLEAGYEFTCPRCDSRLSTRKTLRHHMRVIHKEHLPSEALTQYMRQKGGNTPHSISHL